MNQDQLLSVHYSTQLLESLNWDERQLQALYEYLGKVFNEKFTITINEATEHIKINFGELAAECFTSILNDVMFKNNFHIKETADA